MLLCLQVTPELPPSLTSTTVSTWAKKGQLQTSQSGPGRTHKTSTLQKEWQATKEHCEWKQLTHWLSNAKGSALKNTHTSNMLIRQVTLRKIHVCMHVETINKKPGREFENQGRSIWDSLAGGKGRGWRNYMIIWKEKEIIITKPPNKWQGMVKFSWSTWVSCDRHGRENMKGLTNLTEA